MILLDKDLDVLADGVTEGRRIFANSRAWAIFPVCRCRHNRAITGRHTWRRSRSLSGSRTRLWAVTCGFRPRVRTR